MADGGESLADFFERAPCGFLSTRPDGTIVMVNDTFLDLTGYERDDLVGRRSFASLLSPGGRIYHETHYAPMLQMQGHAREIAFEVVRADGGRLPVLVNAVLERDAAGAPMVVRTAVFDATDRREYERELLRAKEQAEATEARATLLARTLQQTLIPPTPPDIPGLDVAAVFRPAGGGDELGGDFYDVFEIGPGDWAVVIGDVCGKGVEAAIVTALARHTIRAAAVTRHEPSSILATLNQVLLRDGSDRFCTVALVRLGDGGDGTWTATVSCAGHPPPLLLRPGDGNGGPSALCGSGSLLGVMEDADLHDGRTVLRPGDALFLYTDGVVEARRGRSSFFGDDGLAASLARLSASSSCSARALADGVLDEVVAFQGGDPRDDIAIVAVALP